MSWSFQKIYKFIECEGIKHVKFVKFGPREKSEEDGHPFEGIAF